VKVSSISELKKELHELPQKQLVELCLSLAKYKKDNKEFLDYLLFQAHDKSAFITSVKAEIDEHFTELKIQANLYYVKKSLRKLLRLITKYCKYLGDKAAAAELHIYFCQKLKASGIPYHKSQLLINMYEQQLKKINTLINGLHEDLQQDYLNDLEKII
jgi:membrane-anchored protein YejM (alkaline phosphatase superfamily)